MEMPKPDANHARFHALVGEWEGQEKMYPSPWDPKGGESTSRLIAKMDLDGFFLVSHYEQIRGGAVTFQGHGVYGYDTHAKKHTMHWFDTMGGDPGAPAMGEWKDNTISFSHKHHYGQGRYTYTLIEDGVYTFKMEASQDGENWMPIMDATYRRKM
ncbi:MAG: DUF1579 family protein [Phycisphaerales bacterium]|nr:DUF1579 family protein [Phycisphaerales bacterium]